MPYAVVGTMVYGFGFAPRSWGKPFLDLAAPGKFYCLGLLHRYATIILTTHPGIGGITTVGESGHETQIR